MLAIRPAMKLVAKERKRGKIQRRYDEPKTPYQRLMDSRQLSAPALKQLKQEYEALNVAELHRKIEQLRQELLDLWKEKAENGARPRRRGKGIWLDSRRVRKSPAAQWE